MFFTETELKTFSNLRLAGCAVAVITPEELRGSPAKQVEELMTVRAWDAIETLGEEEEDDSD